MGLRFRTNNNSFSGIRCNESFIGTSIEQQVREILENKTPITEANTLIYTERKDGVLPAYNIRTDRFEVAIDAMDYVSKSHLSKRDERMKPQEDSNRVVDGGENKGTDTANEGGTSK